jgi:hypothetical protein
MKTFIVSPLIDLKTNFNILFSEGERSVSALSGSNVLERVKSQQNTFPLDPNLFWNYAKPTALIESL